MAESTVVRKLERAGVWIGLASSVIAVFLYLEHVSGLVVSLDATVRSNASTESASDAAWMLQDQRTERLLDDILRELEEATTELARQTEGLGTIQFEIARNYSRFEELEDLHTHLHELIASSMQTVALSLGKHEGRHDAERTR